jgi:uncharacterized membrane protein (UPF0127 family)
MKISKWILAVSLVGFFACTTSGVATDAPLTPVTLHTFGGDLTVQAEVADSDAERELGLMNRHSLASDRGMLFVFETEEPRAFWMKNTYIPLDMLFVSSAKEIIYIAQNTTPLSQDLISPAGGAQYVLEVKGGYCQNHGITVGDTLSF